MLINSCEPLYLSTPWRIFLLTTSYFLLPQPSASFGLPRKREKYNRLPFSFAFTETLYLSTSRRIHPNRFFLLILNPLSGHDLTLPRKRKTHHICLLTLSKQLTYRPHGYIFATHLSFLFNLFSGQTIIHTRNCLSRERVNSILPNNLYRYTIFIQQKRLEVVNHFI